MEENLVLILLSSLLSGLLGSLIGVYFAWKNNQRSISVNFGSQEMQELQDIQDLELKIIDCRSKIKETEQLKEKLDRLHIHYFNTFECLCARYLAKDEKIDKENFRKMYKEYIIGLCENEETKSEYSENSIFNATMKVYNELKNIK